MAGSSRGSGGVAAGRRTHRAENLAVTGDTVYTETGKDADLALYDGDPLEYTSHCTGTVVSGEVFADGAN